MKGIYALIIFTMILAFILLIRDFSNIEDTYVSPSPIVEENQLSLEEMLVMALKDERRAFAQYELINQIYGKDLSFQTTKLEEQAHIDHLLELFKDYSLEVPIDESSNMTVVPKDLEEAYKLAILLETTNERMYSNFLIQGILPADVRKMFNHLRDASRVHLMEFENLLKYHY